MKTESLDKADYNTLFECNAEIFKKTAKAIVSNGLTTKEKLKQWVDNAQYSREKEEVLHIAGITDQEILTQKKEFIQPTDNETTLSK